MIRIWETRGFPKSLKVGQGCPIEAKLEFSEKILAGIWETGGFPNPLPTPDWSGFCNLLQKGRRTEPLAGRGKLDSREVSRFVLKNNILSI